MFPDRHTQWCAVPTSKRGEHKTDTLCTQCSLNGCVEIYNLK